MASTEETALLEDAPISDLDIVTARAIVHTRRLRAHRILAALAVFDLITGSLFWTLESELSVGVDGDRIVNSIQKFNFRTSLFDMAVSERAPLLVDLCRT